MTKTMESLRSRAPSPKAMEYSSPVKLEAPSGNYFAVPESVILDADANDKRVTAFSFFSVRRGLDCEVTFSVNNIVKWTGREPNRYANGINAKFSQAIERLANEGYISLSGKPSNSSSVDAVFSLDKITEQCRQKKRRFAIIYVDELKKILGYANPNAKDSFFNNDILLLVFAYLRMMIRRRMNSLLPEERNIGGERSHEHDVEMRRIRMPETHDEYYCDMADKLGLSPRAVSDAVDILNELGLIYSEPLPRVMHDGKWRTTHTLFCNRYKREGSYLLAEGRDYYISEAKRRKRQLNLCASKAAEK